MRGYPKYLTSKQDYLNVVIDDIDRENAVRDLKALLNTTKRTVPVFVMNESTGKEEYAGDKRIDDPNGKIYQLGFTVNQVEELIGVIEYLYPVRDLANIMIEKLRQGEFKDTESTRKELLQRENIPQAVIDVLKDKGGLAKAIDDEERDEALNHVECFQAGIRETINTKINQCRN